jgi:hypothetical protein
VRFFQVEENIFAFKTHWATRGVVNFYSAGVITHDRRIGSGFLNTVEVVLMQAHDPPCSGGRGKLPGRRRRGRGLGRGVQVAGRLLHQLAPVLLNLGPML